MRWVGGWIVSLFVWLVVILGPVVNMVAIVFQKIGGAFGTMSRSLSRIAEEAGHLRKESGRIAADLETWSADQAVRFPMPADRKTVFLLITCGQAVRNFMVSDVFSGLKDRFNVIILSPYAYSDDFRRRYEGPGVHILPWFESFRTRLEKFFHYYLMKKSGSRTHASWLENLEARAREQGEGRMRFLKHLALRRTSDATGAVIGRKGMQSLYAAYFHTYLDKRLFSRLFETYRPALVISTTAHHAEAWPLTYHARNNGSATLGNILSWDNPTTKPAMDSSCDHYTVWSEEMKGEMAAHFPYIKTNTVVTGAALFDIYFQRPGAKERGAFAESLGLPANLPYILWTTNTPAGMPDEHIIVREFWHRMLKAEMAGKCALLIRLHPKESDENYLDLKDLPNVALTLAGDPHWSQSDRWLPDESDMNLLVNSMIHAAVSINVASTMSLESFAVGLPTINVAFKSTNQVKDHGLLWSFDMYHASDHYKALVDNGAVDIVRSMDELVEAAIRSLKDGTVRQDAMRRTLRQKAAYSDGTAGRRFVEVVEDIVAGGNGLTREDAVAVATYAQPQLQPPCAEAAE